MRAVVDTNVLVSATFMLRGSPAQIIDDWFRARFEMVVSPALLLELARVSTYPHIVQRQAWTAAERARFQLFLRERAELVEPSRTIAVCRDPADNRVLEAAVAGAADYIVTGDKDLLVLHEFEGIPVVTPSQFLSLLGAPA